MSRFQSWRTGEMPPVGRGLGWSPAVGWGSVAAIAIALSALSTGLFQRELFNPGGWPQLWRFGQASLHPDLSADLRTVALDATLKTLSYAVCGTCLSVLIGAIGGVWCSEVWWTVGQRGTTSPGGTSIARLGDRKIRYGWTGLPFFYGIRAVLAVPRSIHELIWGLLFVNLWGTDPLTAVLAIAVPFGAITAKVFSEILDETPRQPLIALLNSGVAPSTAFFYTLLPQAFLNLLSYAFYRFECSIRAAAVLGIIGAGGLGYQLMLSLQSLRYEQVWTFIYALFVLNGLVDFSSAWLRQRLNCASRLDLNLHQQSTVRKVEEKRSQGITAIKERKSRQHSTDKTQTFTLHPSFVVLDPLSFSLLAAAVLVVFSFWYVGADFSKLWSAQTYRFLGAMVRSSVPPDFSLVEQLVPLSVQTVAMSILAIALAAVGGMVLSFPAAHSLMLPGGALNPTRAGTLSAVGSWTLLLSVRSLLLLCRAVPAPVWALVVLFVLFPGSLPGAIALGVHNLGILGRLKAEVVENLDDRPLEALKAQGAPGSSIFLYGILPPSLPRFLAYDLYRWEVCMRESVIVGLVGAGGLGYLMTEQISSFDYRGLVTTLGCFLILTVAVDSISGAARRSLR